MICLRGCSKKIRWLEEHCEKAVAQLRESRSIIQRMTESHKEELKNIRQELEENKKERND
jgi:hypothetical protein